MLASAVRAISASVVLCASGCAWNIGHEDVSFEATSPRPVDASDFASAKVAFQRFSTVRTISTTTATARSTSGHTASAVATTVAVEDHPQPWVTSAAQRSLPFDAISTFDGLGRAPTYVLEGSLVASWSVPWWTWVQLLDLWLHALFMPTLGSHLELSFELNLFDADQRLVRAWTGERTVTYLGEFVWFTSMRTYGYGPDGAYEKFLADMFDEVGADLRACIAGR